MNQSNSVVEYAKAILYKDLARTDRELETLLKSKKTDDATKFNVYVLIRDRARIDLELKEAQRQHHFCDNSGLLDQP